jgi:hypothetical protein
VTDRKGAVLGTDDVERFIEADEAGYFYAVDLQYIPWVCKGCFSFVPREFAYRHYEVCAHVD